MADHMLKADSMSTRAKKAYESGKQASSQQQQQEHLQSAVQYWSKAIETLEKSGGPERHGQALQAIFKNLARARIRLAVLAPDDTDVMSHHMEEMHTCIEKSVAISGDQSLWSGMASLLLSLSGSSKLNFALRLLRKFLEHESPASPDVSLEIALRLVHAASRSMDKFDFDQVLCEAGSRHVNGSVHIKGVSDDAVILDGNYHGMTTGEKVTYTIEEADTQLTVPQLLGFTSYLRNGQAFFVRSIDLFSVALYDTKANAIAGGPRGKQKLAAQTTGKYGALGQKVVIVSHRYNDSEKTLTFTVTSDGHDFHVGALVVLSGMETEDPSQSAGLTRSSGHHVVAVTSRTFSIAFESSIKLRSPCPRAVALISSAADGMKNWISARQHLQEACIHLVAATSAKARLDGATWQSVREQAQFLFHRGSTVLRLLGALREQHLLMNDEFDMERCYEVMDLLKVAARVAETDDNPPAVLGTPLTDVEMAACCRHYLARLYNAMCMKEKARAEHLACVQMILSIDPREQTSVRGEEGRDEVLRQTISGSRKGSLFKHAWYKESAQYILMAQQQASAASEESLAIRQARIKTSIDELNKANTSKVKFVGFLKSAYPVPGLDGIGISDGMPKKEFLKVISAYHPDKLSKMKEVPLEKGWTTQDMDTLYNEISKRLNHWYETGYK